jgi:uncharacterized membrane protein
MTVPLSFFMNPHPFKPRYSMVGALLLGLLAVNPFSARAPGATEPRDPSAAKDRRGTWHWIPTLIPKALLIEGLWTEFFKVEPAFHAAGIPFEGAYVSRSPYFGEHTRLYHMPREENFNRYSVIVISNLDAPTLKPERLRAIEEFVVQGGGLVVLGGHWAYGRGGYAGTPLEAILPVVFAPEHRLTPERAGMALDIAQSATWKLPALGAAKPHAFYVHTLVPKGEATVQMTVGGKPAFISGSYGKGRVVACALTPHGDPPQNMLPFWEWEPFIQVMAGVLDWASGARPLHEGEDSGAQRGRPLSEEERNALTLGGGMTVDLANRICACPEPETIEMLFAHAIKPEGTTKVELSAVYRTLIAFAKPAWTRKLKESLEGFSPDLNARRASLILLGATKSPEAYPVLLEALGKEDTKEAAVEAIGLLGRSDAIATLQELLNRCESRAKSEGPEEEPAPGIFARQHSGLVAELCVALYRLGDPAGVPKILETYRRVRLYQRIFENAAKRRVSATDAQGLSILKTLQEASEKLRSAREKIRACAGPVPENQRAAFLAAARATTDPSDVEWMVEALEQSRGSTPPSFWKPLTEAKDGILARLGNALP